MGKSKVKQRNPVQLAFRFNGSRNAGRHVDVTAERQKLKELRDDIAEEIRTREANQIPRRWR